MDGLTHLVGKTLLLEVQPVGAGERGTLGSGREERAPGSKRALHGCRKQKLERN